ncbi:MAG: FHA domain-containing protein [Phycisphaerae bacterium]|nr:FHA domain-containing protein [Phycisphaerae bacterium]
MPVPWFHVRLKSAERALRDGRIDEAYRVATTPDLREQRRTQRLWDKLVRPLLARARVHALAGRFDAALADLDKLRTLDRGEPDVTNLRQRILSEKQSDDARRAAENQAYDRAAQQVREGRLESGRLAVDRVDDTNRRDRLANELDVRAHRSAQLLAQAEGALKAKDPLAAFRHWREACTRHGHSSGTEAFADRLATAVCDWLRCCFEDGRLELFLSTLETVAPLRGVNASLFDECARWAELTQSAVAQLATGAFSDLRQTLLRLRGSRVTARWLDEAFEAAEQVRSGRDRLIASPLGLVTPTSAVTAARDRHSAIDVPRQAPGTGSPNKRPLLLLIDGTGSALLLTDEVVRIGRAGGSATIDVPIPAELHSHHADIICRGEDYFLMPRGPARVNSAAIKSAMLRDGDRIALGDHARLTFHKPSVKSETATLKLSDRCRLPMDVSYVVLFRDTCLLGPQVTCHLRTREGASRVVLFMRGGQLHARLADSEGHPASDATPLPLGATQQIGDLSMTVTEYTVGGDKLA